MESYFENRYKITKLKNYLYVIQENISTVHPVYTNDPLNLYLLLGDHTALLIDTGCGLSPLKPVVDKLINKKKLLVFNSHAHWDHIFGNGEFDEVYIHENEAFVVSQPYDLSHSKEIFGKCYANRNFTIPPAKVIKTLRDGDSFDLGKIKIEVIDAPGHSPGSICVITNTGELFTGDVAYYGDQFLPRPRFFPIVLNTLSKLMELCEKHEIINLYPSHRKTPCDKTLLVDLYNGIKNIENIWETRQKNEIFNAYYVEDKKFRYYIF
ncbi:MAG: MBL fold metallo-hydrolase [Promethearchaeota archaeon]|nr:MAG: MBL fold metallo-hydrolase [Candidatus Lokiarchaeota archaeon]